jgi:GTPase SAR1 family protein
LEKSTTPKDLTLPIFKAIFAGPKGVGKTTFVAQLLQKITPPDKEIIWVDSGGEGYETLSAFPGAMDRMRVVDFQGLSQLETLCDAIDYKAGSFGNVGALVLDEFSTMAMKDQDVVLASHVIEQRNKGKNKDADTPEWDEFNANTQRMRRIMYRLLKTAKTSKVHVVAIAHMRDDKMQGKGIEIRRPAFMPKLSETIGENVHILGMMSADAEIANDKPTYTRKIQMHPTRTVDAKTRISGLAWKKALPMSLRVW